MTSARDAALARARVAFAQGEFEAALADARLAAAIPGAVDALILQVNAATRLGALDDALSGLERLHALFPEHAQFARMLSTALNNRAAREPDAAVARAGYERALALWPGNADAHYNLAQLALRDGDGALATAALAAAGADDATRHDAALALALHGELAAARVAIAPLVGRARVDLRAEIASRLFLPPVPASRAALDAAREHYAAGLDDLTARFDPAAIARAEPTLAPLAWSNFLLAYQGRDDRALQSRYGDWLAAAAAALAPELAAPRRAAHPRRVALVSSFFRDSTVGAYFGRWVRALTEAGYETVLYALGPRFDAHTERLEAEASRALRLTGSLDDAARAIRDAEAALVLYPELGMDARTFALAALRLAPLQAMAWGHPVTSGLPTIDAYFTAGAMEPAAAQSAYRERLIALPGLGTAYAPPPAAPALDRSALGLPGGTLYLVPQAAFKIHPDNDAVYAQLLAEDRDATLVLFDNERRGMTERLAARFAAGGIAPARRVFLPMTSRDRYLAINRACDVMVDTLHWSGGNTTLDALAVGLPVVTHRGDAMRGRQSAAMLELLGASEAQVAATPAALAARAVALAHDRGARREIAARVAAGLPALHRGDAALAALVDAVGQLLARA